MGRNKYLFIPSLRKDTMELTLDSNMELKSCLCTNLSHSQIHLWFWQCRPATHMGRALEFMNPRKRLSQRVRNIDREPTKLGSRSLRKRGLQGLNKRQIPGESQKDLHPSGLKTGSSLWPDLFLDKVCASQFLSHLGWILPHEQLQMDRVHQTGAQTKLENVCIHNGCAAKSHWGDPCCAYT